MIISSSNVGMESARTYRSSTTRKLSISQSIVSYRFSDEALGNQSLLGRSEGDENLEAGEGTKTTADNKAAEDAMARMKSNSSPVSARIRELAQGSEDKSIEQIRQKCVLYLWELFFGVLMGVPNYFSSKFILVALNYLPAVIVFPTFSVGCIVVVTLAGLLLFKEKLTKRQWTALAMIMVALAILYI
ncbi:MAG: hypothetical protein IJ339_02530 [Oscillospiraceae bacterium]|nr:hypothetical protein [Oscillospiraceae bacterium]